MLANIIVARISTPRKIHICGLNQTIFTQPAIWRELHLRPKFNSSICYNSQLIDDIELRKKSALPPASIPDEIVCIAIAFDHDLCVTDWFIALLRWMPRIIQIQILHRWPIPLNTVWMILKKAAITFQDTFYHHRHFFQGVHNNSLRAGAQQQEWQKAEALHKLKN